MPVGGLFSALQQRRAGSSGVTYGHYGHYGLALERAVDMGEALRFSTGARLIAGLDRQLRRVERQGYDLLVGGKITATDIGDLPLVTAMHEPLFTWDGNPVWIAALPVPAQQQVEDHPGSLRPA